jgi:hypothetical protein
VNIIKDDMLNYMSNNKRSCDIIFNIESVGYVDIEAYFKEAYECLDDEGIIILKDFSAISDPGDIGKDYGNYIFYNHRQIINSAEKYKFKTLNVTRVDKSSITSVPFMKALASIRHEYTSSAKYTKIGNVICFVIYSFQKT